MPPLLSQFIAQTREQVRLLLETDYSRVVGHLLEGERSASEIAARTGQPLKRVHHKLTRLLAAGLIVQSGERPRKGRPIKLYRAVAAEYRLPFALTDAATLGELIEAGHEPLLRSHYAALSRAGGHDLKLSRSEGGGIELRVDERETQSGEISHSLFLTCRVTDSAARELERRLQELAGWLIEQTVAPDGHGKTYLLGLLLTPRELDE